MDQIRIYVDAMFAGLPNTPEAAEMKRNILENMQERYRELLSQGKNENEALGAVISQFGSIDEIKKALGVEDMPPESAQPVPPVMGVDPALVAEYERHEKNKPVFIAGAVILFVLSPLAYMIGSAITGWLGTDLLGEILLFLLIAAGIGLLVWTYGQESYYRKKLNLPPQTFQQGNYYSRMGRGRFTAAVYPAALLIYLFFGFTIHWWNFGWLIFIAATVAMLLYPSHK